MNYLFIHPNFPGQFIHLATSLGKHKENRVLFICDKKPIKLPGVHKVELEFNPPLSKNIHRYIAPMERMVYRGQAVARACLHLQRQGFTPDIIYAHTGWGDALYLKDIFPNTPVLGYMEFYYQGLGADVHFHPNEKIEHDTLARVRTKNTCMLLSDISADWGITPTQWQFDRHPKELQQKISICHEGINTEIIKNSGRNRVVLPDGTELKKEGQVLTFTTRYLEMYRGFPTFMRAVEILQKECPALEVVIVGRNVGPEVSGYGGKHESGLGYKEAMLKELDLDESRLHFLGYLPHREMLKVLEISSAHIYLTYPFVLSWSVLEAMAMECLVIGSSTPPVEEVITHGKNGFLVDFFDHEALAKQVIDALNHRDDMQPIREAARQTVLDHFNLRSMLSKQVILLNQLASGKTDDLKPGRL